MHAERHASGTRLSSQACFDVGLELQFNGHVRFHYVTLDRRGGGHNLSQPSDCSKTLLRPPSRSIPSDNMIRESSNATFVRASDGSMIELIHAEGERAAQSLKSPGIRHMALAVTNFDEVYADLKSKDVAFLGEPSGTHGNRVVFFSDPEGNYLHLLQRANPLP